MNYIKWRFQISLYFEKICQESGIVNYSNVAKEDMRIVSLNSVFIISIYNFPSFLGLLGFFCYQILIGLNAHRMNESFLLCFCPNMGHNLIRSKVRADNDIDGSLILDCILVYFCAQCTAVQEANEICLVYNKEPKK